MNSKSHYDVAIIGAGMAGLAAGIRIAHFGKKVCIFERHNAVGGLNGFYSIDGRKYDVGLHALTNYAGPGMKGTPLTRLFRQLRIDREEFDLRQQKRSRVSFGERGECTLHFTNEFSYFENEVAEKFPSEIDGFRRLVQRIRDYDGFGPEVADEPSRPIVAEYIRDPLLADMLFCPTMFYGNPKEHDMAFRDFVVLFRAIFLEGFARPPDGVRVILRVLLDKYRAAGGERRMKCGVKRIVERDGKASALILDSGEEVTADHVLSSIGGLETENLYRPTVRTTGDDVGRLSFLETLNVLDCQPAEIGWGDDTIVFFNTYSPFKYECPTEPVDAYSGVVCIPNNFSFAPGEGPKEGMIRCTVLANHATWTRWPEEEYQAQKKHWLEVLTGTAQRFLPALKPGVSLAEHTIARDVFTPRTIEKFTGHLGGCVYGSPKKNRAGVTDLSNLYLCGTDQGYLGIVGAMLSGIAMANQHVLQKS